MMVKKQTGDFLKVILVLTLLSVIWGCASTGEFRGQGTAANVSLEKKNYRIIKVAARGESSGFKLFGIIPFASPTYSEAKESLYESISQPLEGRAIALVNQTEDRSYMYFILFSIPKITLTADIIEYLDETGK
ncbi:MAG: DUF6567 family protein [Desulfobacterales bacterium]